MAGWGLYGNQCCGTFLQLFEIIHYWRRLKHKVMNLRPIVKVELASQMCSNQIFVHDKTLYAIVSRGRMTEYFNGLYRSSRPLSFSAIGMQN